MGGSVEKEVKRAVHSVTDFVGLSSESQDTSVKKTKEEEQAEADAATEAYQAKLKTQRQKANRAKNRTGRSSLSYSGPTVGVSNSKLGGGL